MCTMHTYVDQSIKVRSLQQQSRSSTREVSSAIVC